MERIQERRIVNKLLMMLQMVRQGQSHRVVHMMRSRWWSEEKTYFFRRDLTIPLETPKTKLNLSHRIFHNLKYHKHLANKPTKFKLPEKMKSLADAGGNFLMY